jgi:hypothetical protein
LAIGTMLIAACACSRAPMLPDEFYGDWEFTGSSGGFSGDGDSSLADHRIAILRSNVLETYHSAELVSSVPFTVSRGETILSAEEQWLITLEDRAEPWVAELRDGRLTLSDNVYDGFSLSYERADGSTD